MSNNKTGLRHAMLNSDTLAGEFCEILTLDAIFGDLVQCDGGLPMPFEANVPDPSTGAMLGVAEGIGVLTEGASTSILVPDYQGVYKEVLAYNPAWEGARWDGDAAYAEPGYPVPRLIYAPEATNLCDQSNDLTNAYWTAQGTITRVRDEVGIDGAANTATTLTDTGGTAGLIYNTAVSFPSTSGPIGLVVYVKQESQGASFMSIRATSSPQRIEFQFNKETGEVYVMEDTYGTLEIDVQLIGAFWRVTAGYLGVGSTNQQTIISPAKGPWQGEDAADTGSCVIGQIETYIDVEFDALKDLPPIFTAGAPVTRTARALSFDGANHDPDQSGYYFEWEPSVLAGIGSYGVLTFNASSSSAFYQRSTGNHRIRQWYGSFANIEFNDGVGAGGVHHSGFVIDTDIANSLSAWDNNPGVWTNPLGSAGSIAVSTIDLGADSLYVIKFGPIRRYQAPLDEMKAQLEADIAAGEAA